MPTEPQGSTKPFIHGSPLSSLEHIGLWVKNHLDTPCSNDLRYFSGMLLLIFCLEVGLRYVQTPPGELPQAQTSESLRVFLVNLFLTYVFHLY